MSPHDRVADAPQPTRRGFGVTADLDPAIVRTLARSAEAAGYHTFWSNDTPGGDGLAVLGAAADVTSSIGLGVGVLPLDRWSPQVIVDRIFELELPLDRLVVGVGAGGAPGGLSRVRNALIQLRDSTPVELVVGALGPRMRRLAATTADGLILDWVTPAYAAEVVADLTLAESDSGQPRLRTMAYVFAALGDEGTRRLRRDIDHYADVPSYRAHFERMGASPHRAAVAGPTVAAIRRGLARFDDVLNETIVRSPAGPTALSPHLDLLTAGAPA